MFRTMTIAAVAAVASLSLSQNTFAATLEALKPGVSISVNGTNYLPVSGKIEVSAGDVIKVAAGAMAQVAYNGQCLVSVQPGATYVVQAKVPCPGSYSVNQAALPPVPVEVPVPPAPAAAAGGATGLGPLGIAAAVAGVTGIVATIVVVSKSSSP